MNRNGDANAPKPVLIIEDDAQIRRFLRQTLAEEGCPTLEAANGATGLALAREQHPGLVILDLGLPDRDGVDLIPELLGWNAGPILVLSARTQEGEKIRALDAGADDYLTKPFGVGELQARIRVLRRRAAGAPEEGTLLSFGDIEMDRLRHQVTRQGETVHLTPIEYRLLSILVANGGKVLTHRFLLREAWGPAYVNSAHYLRIYVGRLRQKLEADPAQPRHFLTETGVGYRFQP
ncbi:response regulator [Azospira inquinata]|uniref:Response regulator n=1 Tax=Azospira inquinata TaxID=2785627 RepID=A0A975XTY5_9RHOO|nr:response regulator [Azospira inquinata]QWT46480.1 response regulator [Azospira inquinata]QWT48195.1 response regulator [Azospira inquinata]